MSAAAWRWGFWWRPLGTWGVNVQLDRPALFSERNGYRKVWRVWRLSFEILKAVEV